MNLGPPDRDSDLHLPLPQRVAHHRYTPHQLLLIDATAVVLMFLLAAVAGPHKVPRLTGGGWHTLNLVTDGVTAVAVLFRRRFPRSTLGLLLPIGVAVLCVRYDGPAIFYVSLALYSTVAVSSRQIGVWVTGSVVLTSAAGIVVGGGSLEASSLTGVIAILLLGWLAAENVRASRRYAQARAERVAERSGAAALLHAEQIQQAIAGERVKIARDLHDIVAHAMSVIAVRSGVARMVIETQPDQAREALSIIETTTRSALREMRLLVGMLRETDDPGAELGPVPGIDDLSELVRDTELAGVSVELLISGVTRPLSPAADLSAYRIIQEALTNVVRHASPTTARVQLTYHPTQFAIEVSDDGPAPGTGQRRVDGNRETGHGIIGMRERTTLFGGTLDAGPRQRGFLVHAILQTHD